MMTKKQRKTMTIGIIIGIILLIIISGLTIYLTTDMFHSNKSLFFKYMSKNIENFRALEKDFAKTEEEIALENGKNEKSTSINVNYRSNIGTTSENSDNVINTLQMNVNTENDKSSEYQHRKAWLQKNNEKILELETLQNQNQVALKLNDLFSEYIVAERNNAESYIDRVEIVNKEVKEWVKTLRYIDNREGMDIFTEEEIIALQEKYMAIIEEKLINASFSKKKNLPIIIGETQINANYYIASTTKEELNNMYLKILDTVKQDEIILKKIEENDILKNGLKDKFIKKVEETIEKINQTNIGQEKVEITIYERAKNTLGFTIEGSGYSIAFDNLVMNNKKYTSMTISKDEKETDKVVIEQSENEKEISIVKEGNIKTTILETKKDETKNIVITYEKENKKVELSVNEKITAVNEITNPLEVEENKKIDLETLNNENQEQVFNQIKESVKTKKEQVLAQINMEQIEEVLRFVKIMPEQDVLDSQGITQAEINRFNSKFEILKANEVDMEYVLKVIDAIKDNLKNLNVVSNTELKLELDRYTGNEEMVQKIRTFIENQKNQKYNVDVSYDETTGFVNGIILKIVEKN